MPAKQPIGVRVQEKRKHISKRIVLALAIIIANIALAAVCWGASPADGATAHAPARAKAAPCVTPRSTIPPPMIVKGRHALPGQRRNITTALNIARRAHAPRRHEVALVAAIIVENSGWNKPAGHGTSVGILQLIDVHGSVVWRMQIRNSVGWFLRGAHKLDPGGTWEPAYLAGEVQRPKWRGVYALYRREAWHIVGTYYARC